VSEGLRPNDRIVNKHSAAMLEGDIGRIVTPAPGYDLGPTEPSSPEDKQHQQEKQSAMSTSQ
jgi:hypothetical protein